MILTDSSSAFVGGSVVRAIASATAALRHFLVFTDATISSALAGALGLAKNGAGILTVTGNNTYTGNTAINAGILNIENLYTLPGYATAGRYTVAAGAGLAVSNFITPTEISQILATGNFQAGAFIGFDTLTGTRTYSNALANTGAGALGLVKIGPNTLILTGTNTYTGTTRVLAGILQIGAGATAGSIASASVAISAGATFSYNLNGANLVFPTFSGSGNISASVLAGQITSGDITVGGDVTITTSQQVGGKGWLLPATTTRTITAGSITFTGQTGQSTNTTSNLVFNTSATNGPITLNFCNGETGWWWALQGITANAGTGTVTLTGTRPAAEPWNAVNGTNFTGAVTISVTGTLAPSGNLNITATGPSSITSPITLGTSRSYNFSVNNGVTMTVSAVLGGTSASMVKTGLGTLDLGSAAHTYTGNTIISAGNLTASKTTAGSTATATFSPTTLSVSFATPPAAGTQTYRFFPGATTQTYSTVALTGAPGRSASYNSTNSTLTVT